MAKIEKLAGLQRTAELRDLNKQNNIREALKSHVYTLKVDSRPLQSSDCKRLCWVPCI